MTETCITHETMVGMIKDGVIRKLESEGHLDDQMRTSAKLACYTYLQSRRTNLDEAVCQLKEWLPESFFEEINSQAANIKSAEQKQSTTSPNR